MNHGTFRSQMSESNINTVPDTAAEMLASSVVEHTAAALQTKEWERARMLLSIAVRAEGSLETTRLRAACLSGSVPRHAPILGPVLGHWKVLAPRDQFDANAKRLEGRRFAYDTELAASPAPADADGAVPAGLDNDGPSGEPFPDHQKPKSADTKALLENSFFQRDAEQAHRDAVEARSLLAPPSIGMSTCDLLAALVQLMLSEPFCPQGFAAEMMVEFLACLRADMSPVAKAVSSSGADASLQPRVPISWDAVECLGTVTLGLALREALQDDYFYDETDEDAAAAWRDARAARISALLSALRASHGSVSLQWVRPMTTWAALRALVELPGVTLPVAASLLLFELRRPVLPMCWNALQEAKALGWVPAQADATSAFLHLHARLPAEATVCRQLYRALHRQNVFRLTRGAVIGDGTKGPDDAVRKRRATLRIHLSVISSTPFDDTEADDAPDVDSLNVTADPGALGRTPALPLADVVAEAIEWHQLYPEAGSTPALVVLKALDVRAARCVAAAFAAGSLPKQREMALRYAVETHWSLIELEACSQLLGEEPKDEQSALEKLPVLLRRLEEHSPLSNFDEVAAAGASLFGFGAQCENGLHLAASCNRVAALRSLWTHASRGATDRSLLDLRGRSALHWAAQSGALRAATALMDEFGLDASQTDRDGHSPLAIAAASDQPQLCELLVQRAPNAVHRGDQRPLELAAASGSLESMKVLLAHGAPIDVQPSSGKTALHAAVRAGKDSAARMLIERGCSITLRDRSGRLPHEVVPDALAADFRWLIDLGRQGVARTRVSVSRGPAIGLEAEETLDVS